MVVGEPSPLCLPIREDLTALEEAFALKRRKELYDAKHPETRRGVGGAKARWQEEGMLNDKMSVSTEAPSFAKATAETLGVDPNTIWRSLHGGRARDAPRLPS